MTPREPSSEPPPKKPGIPAPRDAFPSMPLYLFATFSLILPWFGAALIIIGAARLAGVGGIGGDPASLAAGTNSVNGWLLIIAGIACIILDILIDVVWAHPALSRTEEPSLNRPVRELIGRQAIVTTAIADGRGKVEIAGTQWIAEGPDAPAGAAVRITGVRDMILEVARD